jgi:hypothetical protein
VIHKIKIKKNKEESFSYIGCSLYISLITRKKNKETNSSNKATTQKPNEIRT